MKTYLSNDYNEQFYAEQKSERLPEENKRKETLESFVRRVHKKTRDDERVRSYFNQRGISNVSIDKYMLGIWKFGEHYRFVIPVLDKAGKVSYLKLRRTPEDEPAEVVSEIMGQKTSIDKYITYPNNASYLFVGEDELQKSTSSDALICNGELDRIIAIQEGVKMPVVACGGIIQGFHDDWIKPLKNMRNIYLCLGESAVNRLGAEKLANRLATHIPTASVFIIKLPAGDEPMDLTDYFVKKVGSADELFSKYATFYCGAKPIDPKEFKEMTIDDIAAVLDATIKYDFVSKVVTFLAMILTYTESDQLNVMFNADSSTGKTYICTEVSKLFPPQDVKTFAKTTPTAFYYSKTLGRTDEKTGQPYVDLERLILIFTEQPDTKLQENLRSVLSHDSKRTPFALTNKNKNGRNSADEGYILGFPSAFFCSANMRIDEQEQTRCLILSPESTREKLLASIDASIARNSNKDAYNAELERNDARRRLMERVVYIKSLNVNNIDIGDSDYLKKTFMKDRKTVLPKTQREVSHFISLVKAMALINAPFRMVDSRIVTNNNDVNEAARLWGYLAECISYGVSPQLLNYYKSVILAAFYAKKEGDANNKIRGITFHEIIDEVFKQTGSFPNTENIQKQYLPALEAAALISREKDENDKRYKIIIPLVFFDDDLENKV